MNTNELIELLKILDPTGETEVICAKMSYPVPVREVTPGWYLTEGEEEPEVVYSDAQGSEFNGTRCLQIGGHE